MKTEQFEAILKATCDELTREIRAGKTPANSNDFEEQVRRVLAFYLANFKVGQALDPKVQGFPDIIVGHFGIEVKFTVKDTWVSVANSINESHRAQGIDRIYILFGKMGGVEEIRFAPYEDVVYHARTSHRPRFQVDMKGDKQSLFDRLGITYLQFAALPYKQKMDYMRAYARSRKDTGIDFWWLEEDLTPYDSLSVAEQCKIKAEAALLIPALINSSDQEALLRMALYMASSKRVLSHESHKVFGTDVLAGLCNLEMELEAAANGLLQVLIEDYWGHAVIPKKRLSDWVAKLDDHFPGDTLKSRPSQILFGGKYSNHSD